MLAALLIMIIGGIALTQTVSDPKQVTLRWLRLGGLINIAVFAFAVTASFFAGRATIGTDAWPLAILALPVIAQLLTVQMGWRVAQRVSAGVTFIVACVLTTMMVRTQMLPAGQEVATDVQGVGTATMASLAGGMTLANGLVGGFIMTMLLGHAYLTAGGEMTQKPFLRLVRLLAALMMVRLVLSLIFGLWPFMQWQGDGSPQVMRVTMITARYLVGIVVPGVFVYMIDDCVRRRSNQSATGILYVAGFLVIMGEAFALSLIDAKGWVF